ncbi:MAG: peroxiredoxin-like family protein [Hyphomicrobiaceae bacterium]|nr:peroxiredoxin-like family protein [Hyphomicrobiaceae bacterium]
MSADRIIAEFERARALDAPLAERLGIYASALREYNQPVAEAADRLVERLKQGELASGAPAVGEALPPFLLPDTSGELVGLDDILADGPAAVSFIRGHWCPYCRLTMAALAEAAGQAAQLGGRIVAILPERQEYATRLRNEAGAPFPVLTDIDNGYALSLQLTFWLGEELETYMRSRDIDLGRAQGNESWFVPVPATFVVGRDGIIAARHVDPDYRNRMETQAIVEAIRSLA